MHLTEQLASEEPGVEAFDAEIRAVDGREVVLDRTYFYAEGGGQPADRGTLDGVRVTDVRERDGSVVHVLESKLDRSAGDSIVGVVDGEFRRYCMRAHTASHALYGAGRRLLADLGYGGFGIGPEKVRVDFETTTEIDDATLVELERLVNRAVWDSREVTWERVPVGEARERDGVAFNTKTEEGVMANAGAVRIVTIGPADGDDEPWDVAACGGTHVRNTREIGPVEVLDRSNPGEGLTRVEFAVGPPALARRASTKRAGLAAARTLGTGVEDLPTVAARLREENAELETALRDLRAEVLDGRFASLEPVEKDGHTWRIGEIDGFDSNELGDRAQAFVGDGTDVLALVGGAGRAFVVVAAAPDAAVAAGDVVSRVTEEFGGGGGGGPTFAQGGGLDAEPADVAAFLRS